MKKLFVFLALALSMNAFAGNVEAGKAAAQKYNCASCHGADFNSPNHEFVENGIIGNPMRATKAKGEEAFHRFSTHVAKGVLELMKMPVTVKNREFVNRV